MAEHVLGTFTFEKATPGTFRYQHENANGRKDTQYVPKELAAELGLKGTAGETLEVVLRTTT